MSIEGDVIIVTGGTSGIGEGCTRYFARIGAKVVTASNEEEKGRELEKELRAADHDVSFIYTDVSKEQSVRALIDQTLQIHGRVDGVFSNAGVWRGGTVRDFNDEDWELMMGVNVRGNMYVAKHVAEVYEQQGEGVLVITTSTAAFRGFPEHAVYCASKAALEALIRCLTTDHGDYMRAVGVCPGTIDTPMLAASAEGFEQPLEELYADVADNIPMGRLGEPEDVAKLVAFLLSDDADYIAGTSVRVEGGTLALPPW